ncbi:NUDIX hydrolase [Aliiroseovarius sediminis]|uniref:NUDIX hydrolase n=1 Tax=Aliiroseovarius sediminis TaxID=2925839 RepID=UPI001F59ABC3|nr:NUDIX hydrolase [Aliiroseovarius sediminis]MCI2395353.1 NUDIX hydrolase [Aliiroseovarius sediminis]
MTSLLKQAWEEVFTPLFQRPNRVQVAALCYRGKGDDKEVLLITSRGTGRWILPKGWPMDGMDAAEAAREEAWEEAGVAEGQLNRAPIGAFASEKEMDHGGIAQCTTSVFPLKVVKLVDDFPEAGERKRTWVTADQAAEMVREKELQDLLRKF